MPSAVENKTIYMTARTLNTVNDTVAGGGTASITGIGRCPGALGSIVYLDPGHPVVYTAGTGTLYPGAYQYVHLVSTSTAAAAVGGIAYWVNPLSSSVPYDVSADAVDGNQAGVFINVLTKGNYGFIQVGGLATVLYGTITKATPAIKDWVICTSGTGTADILADATSLTSVTIKRSLGTAESVPASTTKGQVFLQLQKRNE